MPRCQLLHRFRRFLETGRSRSSEKVEFNQIQTIFFCMKMVWISKYLLFFKNYGWVFSQLIVAWDICTEPWNTLQPMTITNSIFWWQVHKESIILSIKTPNLTRTHICIARKNVMLPQIVGLLFPFRCIFANFCGPECWRYWIADCTFALDI